MRDNIIHADCARQKHDTYTHVYRAK